MQNYALIEGGLVVNVVICDSDEAAMNLFRDMTVIRIDGAEAGPGWQYSDGVFIKPAVEPPSEEEVAAQNILKARGEYERATLKIKALNERIEDEDYAGISEEAVKAELSDWTYYRKQLRAYINASDGREELPTQIQ